MTNSGCSVLPMRYMLCKFAGDDVNLQNDQTMENFNAKYVNPLSDWGFKRLFGTEMNKELLLEFLRSLFPERSISDIAYLGNERQNLSERERDSVFDVVCTDAGGAQFVVEMQKRTQRYFRDRALYYAAYPIIEQAPKGSWNYRLKPVCVVGILNFAMEHEYGPDAERWREKLIHRYRLREDETGEIMNSKLEFLYLEVGAFRKEISGSSPSTDKWMYVLKNLSRLEERPQALRERVFERLFEAAKIAAYTKEERNQYENDMMTENDYRNTIDYARDEGMAEGKAEVARKMLAAGMPAEQITEFTGLTAEQLAALK